MKARKTPPPLAPLPSRVPPSRARRRYIPNLVNWLVIIFVLGTLFSMASPFCSSRIQFKGRQTKSLAQAKQIGLALKMFAADHDGNYPRVGLPGMPPASVGNANEAFAMLFPTYATSEGLFANPLSAYQTHQPDGQIDPAYTGRPVHTLEPGENVYAYMAGLTDRNNPDAPLVADGTDGTGHYTTDQKKRGGVWDGKKAIVMHLDNSARLETLAGPEHSRFIPRRPGDSERDAGNQLDVSGLGPGVRLLDPAVSR